MSEKEQDEEEVYYGVIIPFETQEQAEFVKAEVRHMLGYGSWIRVGTHDVDD